MTRWIVLLAALVAPAAHAQFDTGSLPDLSGLAGAIAGAADAPAPTGLARSGLDVPRVDPGEAATKSSSPGQEGLGVVDRASHTPEECAEIGRRAGASSEQARTPHPLTGTASARRR